MSGSTKRNMIIALLLIMVAGASFGVMAYQVISQGERLHEQIAVLEEQNKQEASYYRLVRLAEETTGERAKLQEFFLEREGDSIDFLSYVESMAPKAGVVLETKRLEAIKEKDGSVLWIEVTFDFSGDRHNVQNFIKLLETLPYVQRLSAVDMKARSAANWEASVTMRIRLSQYDDR